MSENEENLGTPPRNWDVRPRRRKLKVWGVVCVGLLLAGGAVALSGNERPSASSEGKRHAAVRKIRPELSKELLDAACTGDVRRVEELLRAGADVAAADQNGETSLMGAVENGHEAVVRLLLEKGAPVHARDKRGRTALDFCKDPVVRRLLRDAGGKKKGKNASVRKSGRKK